MQDYSKLAVQVRPHDLVWFQGSRAIVPERIPLWVQESLSNVPVAVVRRASHDGKKIPIGIRGSFREQRFAAVISSDSIVKTVSPERLCVEHCIPRRSRYGEIPALRGFQDVLTLWKKIELPWGPTGSVGFELGTGCEVATPQSDLDLIVRVPKRLSRDDAKRMLAELSGVGVPVDVQLETPSGVVAIKEYCSVEEGQEILLRTIHGPVLVLDPWNTNGGELR